MGFVLLIHRPKKTTSFKEVLISYCDEFLESSDQVPERTRLKLITKVLKEIVDIAKELMDASLPDDLEKVIPIFNMNIKILTYVASVSRHGSVTMPVEMPRRGSQQRIHAAI